MCKQVQRRPDENAAQKSSTLRSSGAAPAGYARSETNEKTEKTSGSNRFDRRRPHSRRDPRVRSQAPSEEGTWNKNYPVTPTARSEEALGLARLNYSTCTRICARFERERERYFAYATALRIASGPAYQIGPYRNRSLIRSTPSPLLRGRTS